MRVLLISILIAACGGTTTSTQTTTVATPISASGLGRLQFNQTAVRLGEPIYWANDANENGELDPSEVRALRFYGTNPVWVDESGNFTDAYAAAYARIVAAVSTPQPGDARARAVRLELDMTAPTLIENDLRELPEAHRAFARHMVEVGRRIDELYARQVGMSAMADQVASDEASRALFRRNWGPNCRGSATESLPECSAIEGAPSVAVDVYPAELQAADGFCTRVEVAAENAEDLTDPFTVVRSGESGLVAVPYTEAYEAEMGGIARELRAAAAAVGADQNEGPLVAYLNAAAQAFEDNIWGPADEAWAAMNVNNSRWYVRVAPDEVYWDPCSHKAGFHMTFALINRDSLSWQERLDPIKADMEAAIAELTPAYDAREVSFHLPDFIDIVVNAGDDRDPFGATIGQSLPNWGAVANEGRGRTVAMTNLYTDPDSQARRREVAASLLSAEALAMLDDDPSAGLMSTILHEATHNLGPAHEYEHEGQTATQAFGGGMASMLEELKAQSGALFYVEMLRSRGLITDEQAQHTYMDSIVWAFGHISRGMWSPGERRKAYSQLAAVQVGFLIEHGVLTYDASATAANGEDTGAFSVDLSNFPAVARELMTEVVRIKASNDREAAEAMAARYVGATSESVGDSPVPHAAIVERYRRFPKTTFVYALSL